MRGASVARDGLAGWAACEHHLGCPPPRDRVHVYEVPNKALWEKCDFTRIAATMLESGEALVKSFGITKGLKVLDLGCGDGVTALPAAALGADVLGVDIAENLVEAGNKRAREHGLSNCTFQEGDATNPGPPSGFLGEFRSYYGPTMNAFAAAEGTGRAEELQADLEALFDSQNTSASLAVTRVPATFLRVTVIRE